MKGFETPKKMFTWLCIYPEAEGTSWLEKMAHITLALVVLMANFCAALAHLGYLVKFIAVGLKGSVFAFMSVIAFASLTYIIITVFRLRIQICSIIDNLLKIYRNRKYFDQILSIVLSKMEQTVFWFYFLQYIFRIRKKNAANRFDICIVQTD